MAIDLAQARQIAWLARLELGDAELTRLARELGSILDYVAVLDELDTSPGAPAAAADAEKPLRDDRPRQALGVDEALENAPDPAGGFFRVPRSLPQ